MLFPDIVIGIRDIWLDIFSLLLPCVLCPETSLGVEKRIDMKNGMHVPLFSHRKTVLISLEDVGEKCSDGKNIGFEARKNNVQILDKLYSNSQFLS